MSRRFTSHCGVMPSARFFARYDRTRMMPTKNQTATAATTGVPKVATGVFMGSSRWWSGARSCS